MMKKIHSEEFLGDYRDFWWDLDFLKLMAKRWKFGRIRKALDVGCGIGHWTRIFEKLLPRTAVVVGIDREEKWVREATKMAKRCRLGRRLAFQVGDALALPFQENAFELVTCQTLLIHVKDIAAAVREMRRVLKPGGLLIACEPNNISSQLFRDSVTKKESIEDTTERIRFQLTCERGKAELGEGDDSGGDFVAEAMVREGFQDVEVTLSNKTNALIPPYGGEGARRLIEQMKRWVDDGCVLSDKEETKRRFLRGGGFGFEFERYWLQALESQKAVIRAIESGTYFSSGAAVMYLVSGRKPA